MARSDDRNPHITYYGVFNNVFQDASTNVIYDSREVVVGKLQGAFLAGKNYASKKWSVWFKNPKSTAVSAPDATIKIPSSVSKAATTANKAFAPDANIKISSQISNVANKVGVAYNAVLIGKSAYDDYKQGTTRNTVTTTSCLGAAYGGGLAGAQAGAVIGTRICPGIGTTAGAIIGSIGGAIGASKVAEKIVDTIADEAGLDIQWFECQRCRRQFKCRKYTEQSREFCPKCIIRER